MGDSISDANDVGMKDFSELIMQMDKEGCFDDIVHNIGTKQTKERELESIVSYQESIKKPGRLDFLGL